MEKDREQALLVRKMQDYIKAHINDESLNISGIAAALGYSVNATVNGFLPG